MIDQKLLRLSFYDAADGPRIMLFGPKEVDMAALQDCFFRLSRGDDPIELESQPFVFVDGDLRLRLETSGGHMRSKASDSFPGLRRVCEESFHFNWLRTNEGWDYLAELIDSVVKSNSPCHQYLTRYPGEDAIVVVSKAEYGDDVLGGK